MSEADNINSSTPGQKARRRDHLVRWGKRVAVAALLFAVLFLAFRWLAPTPERQLAAFDAAHAVPDEDNAALIYAELLRGEEVPPSKLATAVARINAAVMDPVSVLEFGGPTGRLRELELSDGISDPNVAARIASRPWRSADCPELKHWLDERRIRIDRLQQAARKPVCHFPLRPTPGQMSLFDVPLGAIKQHAQLLVRAVNHDLGEGDIDAGLAKCEALMSLGQHLCTQPSKYCLLSGVACEAMALHCLAESIVEGPATDRHLDNLAARCAKIDSEWDSLRRDISYVRDLYSHLLNDQRPLRFRVATWYSRIRRHDRGWFEEDTREFYLRVLSERRGLRILIELRRFKDRTGQWPQSLDQIAASLPAEALVDPSSDCPYVYRLSGQGFSLYSVGPNRIDEKGQRRGDGPDDWLIWPPRSRNPVPEPRDANGV